jgi:hypothetical protein
MKHYRLLNSCQIYLAYFAVDALQRKVHALQETITFESAEVLRLRETLEQQQLSLADDESHQYVAALKLVEAKRSLEKRIQGNYFSIKLLSYHTLK